MTATTENWSPDTCACFIQHKFQEGPGAQARGTPGNPFEFCSIQEATLIRLEKHQRLVQQYTLDGDTPALQGRLRWWGRQADYSQTICPEHSGLSAAGLYGTLRDESGRQNITWNIILVLNPSLEFENLSFVWTGQDDRRVLTVRPVAGSAADSMDKTAVRSAADLQFGPGKVVVQ